MSSAEQVPQEMMNRAHWLRSEGMVLFTTLAETVYPSLGELIADSDINKAIQAPVPFERRIMRLTKIFAHFSIPSFRAKLNEQVADALERQYTPDQSLVYSHVSKYTHWGNRYRELGFYNLDQVLDESALGMTFMPINLLVIMKNYIPEDHPLRKEHDFETFTGLAEVMKSSWFHDLCLDAADTAREFWGDMSLWFGGKSRFLDLPGPEVLSFDKGAIQFSPAVASNLKEHLMIQNKLFGPQQSIRDDGSSTGCPVRYLQPSFNSSELDQQSLQELSLLFGMPVEELTRKREKSGIDLGLDALADLFERAGVLLGERQGPPRKSLLKRLGKLVFD